MLRPVLPNSHFSDRVVKFSDNTKIENSVFYRLILISLPIK